MPVGNCETNYIQITLSSTPFMFIADLGCFKSMSNKGSTTLNLIHLIDPIKINFSLLIRSITLINILKFIFQNVAVYTVFIHVSIPDVNISVNSSSSNYMLQTFQ